MIVGFYHFQTYVWQSLILEPGPTTSYDKKPKIIVG